MLCRVIKRFDANGRTLTPGEIVESGGWKWEGLLLEHRYLLPTSPPAQPVLKPTEPAEKKEPISVPAPATAKRMGQLARSLPKAAPRRLA